MKDKGLHFGHAEFEVSIHTLVEMSTGVDCAHQELSTNNYTRHLDLSCRRTLVTLQTMGGDNQSAEHVGREERRNQDITQKKLNIKGRAKEGSCQGD